MPYHSPEREKHRRKMLRKKKKKTDPHYERDRKRIYRARLKGVDDMNKLFNSLDNV